MPLSFNMAFKIIALILGILTNLPVTRSTTEPEIKDTDLSIIDEVISDMIKCRNIPGLSLAVVKDGKTLVKKGYGLADIENNIAVDEKTVFSIASMSKQMSVSLVAILMAEKGISWDTKVKGILDDFQMPTQYLTDSVTISDIVGHRTGLAPNDFTWLFGEFTRDEAYRRLKYFKQQDEFRDKFLYNNIVFSIVSRISEKLGGKSWEDLMEERLFKPLGMTSSTFYDQHAPNWKDFAKPYAKDDDGPLYPVNQMATSNVHAVGPAGSIASNAEDMAKYLEFLVNKGKSNDGSSLLPEGKFDEIFATIMVLPQPWFGGALELPIMPVKRSLDAYAKGWTTGIYRGYRIISHFGNLYGYDGLLSYLPEKKIAIFSNTNGPMGRQAVISHLLFQNFVIDILLGEKPWLDKSTICSYPSPWMETQPSSMQQKTLQKEIQAVRPLQEYVGTYGNLEFGNVTIFVDQDTKVLHMKYGKLGRFVLYPQKDKDRFSMETIGAASFMKETQTKYLDFVYVQFDSSSKGKFVNLVSISIFNFFEPPSFERDLVEGKKSTKGSKSGVWNIVTTLMNIVSSKNQQQEL